MLMTVAPVAICANNGPGQAPVSPQPAPNNNPPQICPLLNFFLSNQNTVAEHIYAVTPTGRFLSAL